jgi:hypothetical protein
LPPSSIPYRRRHPFLASMAGKSLVLPANPWIRSSVTEKKLQDLMRDGLTTNFRPLYHAFCRNGKVSLQQGLLSQRFSLLVAIDWFFAMKIVLWP